MLSSVGGGGVCVWVVGLGKLQGLCEKGGGANLRGLIMTPYHSPQELPSFAHHITCMA